MKMIQCLSQNTAIYFELDLLFVVVVVVVSNEDLRGEEERSQVPQPKDIQNRKTRSRGRWGR
jgi:hypothetical protein